MTDLWSMVDMTQRLLGLCRGGECWIVVGTVTVGKLDQVLPWWRSDKLIVATDCLA